MLARLPSSISKELESVELPPTIQLCSRMMIGFLKRDAKDFENISDVQICLDVIDRLLLFEWSVTNDIFREEIYKILEEAGGILPRKESKLVRDRMRDLEDKIEVDLYILHPLDWTEGKDMSENNQKGHLENEQRQDDLQYGQWEYPS
eukprot:Awhi_evm1s7663